MEGKHKDTSLPAPGGPFVDVRDAAMAHVLGIKVEAAGGQRFLTSPDDIIGNDYCKVRPPDPSQVGTDYVAGDQEALSGVVKRSGTDRFAYYPSRHRCQDVHGRWSKG